MHYSNYLGSFVAGLAFVGLGVSSATAATATSVYTLTDPTHFANAGANEQAAQTSATGTTGNGSWQAVPGANQHIIYVQGGSNGPAEGGPKSYATEGANPRLLFPASSSVTLGDLTNISFDTDAFDIGTGAGTGDGNVGDWYVNIWTKADGLNDAASWYGDLFTLLPGDTANSAATNGFTTHKFDANGGVISRDAGGGETSEKFTLAELVASGYASEEIRFVAILTQQGIVGFDGRVDNFNFGYGLSGDAFSVNVNLDQAVSAVPLPATLPLLLAAVGGAAFFNRKRKTA